MPRHHALRAARRAAVVGVLTTSLVLPTGALVGAASAAAPALGDPELLASTTAPAPAAGPSVDAPTDEPTDVAEDEETDAGSATPGKFSRATLTQKGWWSHSNEPPPETGVAQPPNIPAIAAPAGTLPVTLVGGEVERIVALEFSLAGEAGSKVKKVHLALAESTAPGANANNQLASIQACPVIDSSLVAVENGQWATRPEYDCDLASVPGVRDDEGVWRFDVTKLARYWTAEVREAAPAVVLVGTVPETPAEDASAPTSFQVGFDALEGIGANALTVARAGGGTDSEEEPAEPGDDGDAPDLGGDTPVSSGGTSGGIAPIDDGGSVPSLSDPGSSTPETAPGAEAPAEEATTTSASPSFVPVAASPLPWNADLGIGSIALLVLTLGLAYLLMLAMGPAGRPDPAVAGRRGVSRALERLAASVGANRGDKS